MDVAAFVDALPPSPFASRVARAIDVVDRALHVYGAGELVISFNGGKDSTAVLHVLRAALARRAAASESSGYPGAAGATPTAPRRPCTTAAHAGECPPGACVGAEVDVRVPAVYFDTPADFPEVTAFMASAAERYGFSVQRLPRFPAGMAALVARGVRGVLMGTRRGDPDGAGLEHFSPTSVGWPPLMRVCPLLEWTYGDVWTFLRGARLPYCALYDAGFTSLGTVDDSGPNPRLALCDEAPAAAVAAAGNVEGEVVGAPRYRPAWSLDDDAAERLGRGRGSVPGRRA